MALVCNASSKPRLAPNSPDSFRIHCSIASSRAICCAVAAPDISRGSAAEATPAAAAAAGHRVSSSTTTPTTAAAAVRLRTPGCRGRASVAFTFHRRAVAALRDGHPREAAIRTNLGTALAERFARTVYRSQGSEYPYLIIPMITAAGPLLLHATCSTRPSPEPAAESF